MMRKILFLCFVVLIASLLSNAEIYGQSKTKRKRNTTKKTTPVKTRERVAVQPKQDVPQQPPYTIEEIPNQDGKGNTLVRLKPIKIVTTNRDNWFLSVSFYHKDDWSDRGKFNVVEFTVSTVSTDWKYANYSEGTVMADGEKLYIFSQGRKPFTRNDNLVQENIVIYILPEGLLILARARRVDVEIGVDKYQLPSLALTAIRDFATRMSPPATK